MSRKTFISYKYDEASDVRDRIINALGSDATYYKGETSESPDLSDLSTERIKEKLKEMIYDTSVTIVVISPRMKESKWIDWEIEYSLREYKRGDRTSHSNGVVGVVMKYMGSYDWIRTIKRNPDGHMPTYYDESLLFDVINKNRFNQNPKKYLCSRCKTVDALTGCYISLIEEDDFLANPNKYIENAYEKSQNLWNYDISKTR